MASSTSTAITTADGQLSRIVYLASRKGIKLKRGEEAALGESLRSKDRDLPTTATPNFISKAHVRGLCASLSSTAANELANIIGQVRAEAKTEKKKSKAQREASLLSDRSRTPLHSDRNAVAYGANAPSEFVSEWTAGLRDDDDDAGDFNEASTPSNLMGPPAESRVGAKEAMTDLDLSIMRAAFAHHKLTMPVGAEAWSLRDLKLSWQLAVAEADDARKKNTADNNKAVKDRTIKKVGEAGEDLAEMNGASDQHWELSDRYPYRPIPTGPRVSTERLRPRKCKAV